MIHERTQITLHFRNFLPMPRLGTALDGVQYRLILAAVVERWARHLILADRIAQVGDLMDVRMLPADDVSTGPPVADVWMPTAVGDHDVAEPLYSVILFTV